MSRYYQSASGETRDIPDDLMAAWVAASNPKAQGWLPVPPQPSEDAVWDGQQWIVPVPSVPESVSARQIRLWLVLHGIALSAIEQAIDSIPDQMQRDGVRVEWEYAPYVVRTHPMLVPLAATLGLTEAQVDQAFREASVL